MRRENEEWEEKIMMRREWEEWTNMTGNDKFERRKWSKEKKMWMREDNEMKREYEVEKGEEGWELGTKEWEWEQIMRIKRDNEKKKR